MSIIAIISDQPGIDDEIRAVFTQPAPDVARVPMSGAKGDISRLIATLPSGGDVVVLVGPGLDPQRSLDILKAIDQERSDIVTVLAAQTDPSTLQRAITAGARGLLPPGSSSEQVADVLNDALDVISRRRVALGGTAEDPRKRVMAVVSAKGGTGKTSVAANLAVALATAAPGQVALVDFDLQFGDVEYALRLKPELTIADLARAGDRVDSTSVKAFLTPHPSGVFALCGPSRPVEAEQLTGEMLANVIELLSRDFRYIVIDTAGGIDDAALVAMDNATDLVLMSSTDIPSVRAIQKTVEALTALGLDDRQWHYVLNRSDAKVGLDGDDVKQAVGLPIDLAVPDARIMTLAMNQGSPVVESDPKSAAARAIATFAMKFLPEPVASGRKLGRRSK